VPQRKLEIVGPGERYGLRLEQQAQRLGLEDAVRFHGFAPRIPASPVSASGIPYRNQFRTTDPPVGGDAAGHRVGH